MLEKMVQITCSPSNEWIQEEEEEEKNHKIDDHQNTMVSIMDKKVATFQQQQNNSNPQQQQEALRCSRCDSNNTKFCYYNNYSLSQPRHFCKTCQRYWTRGGTLRSVPVGGGCRKNKRLKRLNTTATTNSNNLQSGSGSDTRDLGSNSGSNSLLYGFPSNNLMNFPFLRYDLESSDTPPQINGLELGFSYGHGELFRNLDNTNNSNKQNFQDLVSSNNLLSNYGNNNSNNSTNPTISSLLASTLQMKGNNFGTILPSSYDEGSLNMKGGVKMEVEGQNRSFGHQWSNSPPNNPNDQMGLNMDTASPDPDLIWGNGPNLGAWFDPSNNHLGSSVS